MTEKGVVEMTEENVAGVIKRLTCDAVRSEWPITVPGQPKISHLRRYALSGATRGRSMALEKESGCAVASRRERCTGTVAGRIMLALD